MSTVNEKTLAVATSTIGEPWWTCGEVIQESLAPQGWTVGVIHESYSHKNIPWILERKADIGVTSTRHLAAATERKGVHADSDLSGLVAIATIVRPSWLGLAARRDLGIASLDDVRERKMPIRLLAGGTERGGELDVVLRHHGLTLDEIVSWGGQHFRWSGRMNGSYVRDGVVDVMLGNIYAGYTPHGRFWYEATILNDMRFLDFGPKLIDELVHDFGYSRGIIPEGLFPGVDRDIPSVEQENVLIYCRRDLPDDVAGLIARALDENADLFKAQRSPFYYERHQIGRNAYLPLHPAVESYYRSKGYPIETPATR